MKKRYRAGIIGLGRIGFTLQFDKKREQPASHSAAIASNKNFELSGGYDTDLSKMTVWSRRYPKAKIYDNLNEMLSDGRWDLIVAAVNEGSHLPVMESILAARPGLVVLEKPVAPSLAEAEKILKLRSKTGVPVLVNHERRFSRDYQIVEQLIASGKLGNVRTVHGSIFSPNLAWRKGDGSKGMGTLVHDGTHLIDTVRFLTGKNVSIEYAQCFGKTKNCDVEGISAAGKLGSDSFLTLDLGYRTRQFGFEIELNCDHGRARVGNGILDVSGAVPSPYYEGFYSLQTDKNFSVKKTGRTEYFSGMIRHCEEVLEGKTRLRSSLEDGIESMRAVERIAKLTGCI